jgi:hypothetical protein
MFGLAELQLLCRVPAAGKKTVMKLRLAYWGMYYTTGRNLCYLSLTGALLQPTAIGRLYS